MLHSRTKTVKAYGRRSNTRVINIHTDFHEAIQLDKTKRVGDQVLQDKTAHNVPDGWSESDGSDDDAIVDSTLINAKSGVKVAGKRNIAKGNRPTPIEKKATPIEGKRSMNTNVRSGREVEIPLESPDLLENKIEVEDESLRPTAPSSHSTRSFASSPSSRPVLRNRRNGRKVLESSDESGSESEKPSGANNSIPSRDSAKVDEVLLDLKELSLATNQESNLATLFAACHQELADDFTSFVTSHSIPAFPETAAPNERGKRPIEHLNAFRKIGEASYSEVFGVWSASTISAEEPPRVVMKVVPLDLRLHGASSRRSTRLDEEMSEDEVCLTRVENVIKEIEITRLMNGTHKGFVKLHDAHVVCGAYPEILLESWDAFKADRGSESPRPDCLPADQHYLLLFLENAGTDLESYRFDKTNGWRQAVEVLWQVADSLATAEEKAKFEHRDLHEGQVLLSDSETGELRATVIDFGLSRAKSAVTGELFWTRIPEDVFDGQGEQWDVYRAMKTYIEADGDDWDGFHPVTNLMWLHYLTRRLLYATPTLIKPRSKALSRVMSRRDPSRSPIRRRTTRTTAAALATQMMTGGTDQGAELEAWEKLRLFEEACKAGLAECATPQQEGRCARIKPNKGRTLRGSAKSRDVVSTAKEAALWLVSND